MFHPRHNSSNFDNIYIALYTVFLMEKSARQRYIESYLAIRKADPEVSYRTRFAEAKGHGYELVRIRYVGKYNPMPRSRILLEKLTVNSSSQEISCLLCNPKIHKSSPLVPILNQMNSVTLLYPISLRYIRNYPPIYAWVFQVASSLLVFRLKFRMHFSFPMRATSPAFSSRYYVLDEDPTE
jgi:hypothetical protein